MTADHLISLLGALGTITAAGFAAWAAWAAQQAASASRDLVLTERARDAKAAQEEVFSQARRVVVELMTQPVVNASQSEPGRIAHLVVTNASVDPIFKVRIKVVVGDATWGPQLIGGLTPGQRISLTAFVATTADDSNTDGYARFVDSRGVAWVASARNAFRQDDEPGLKDWISEGRDFASRDLTPIERGQTAGVEIVPNLEEWLSQFDRPQLAASEQPCRDSHSPQPDAAVLDDDAVHRVEVSSSNSRSGRSKPA
jgi:hypothetical protein